MVEAHSVKIDEPTMPGKGIPTLDEYMRNVSARMVALAPCRAAALDQEVDRVCAAAGPCFDDLLTLLAYSRGCQDVSISRYMEGDTGNGVLYQHLGQICMDRALGIMGQILSQSVADGLIVTH